MRVTAFGAQVVCPFIVFAYAHAALRGQSGIHSSHSPHQQQLQQHAPQQPLQQFTTTTSTCSTSASASAVRGTTSRTSWWLPLRGGVSRLRGIPFLLVVRGSWGSLSDDGRVQVDTARTTGGGGQWPHFSLLWWSSRGRSLALREVISRIGLAVQYGPTGR